jgi:hypothetical protein
MASAFRFCRISELCFKACSIDSITSNDGEEEEEDEEDNRDSIPNSFSSATVAEEAAGCFVFGCVFGGILVLKTD